MDACIMSEATNKSRYSIRCEGMKLEKQLARNRGACVRALVNFVAAVAESDGQEVYLSALCDVRIGQEYVTATVAQVAIHAAQAPSMISRR